MGTIDTRALDREQRATHGLAWLATNVEALRQLAAYADRLAAGGNFDEIGEPSVRMAGEYLAQSLRRHPYMSQAKIGAVSPTSAVLLPRRRRA